MEEIRYRDKKRFTRLFISAVNWAELNFCPVHLKWHKTNKLIDLQAFFPINQYSVTFLVTVHFSLYKKVSIILNHLDMVIHNI